jgi:uncharacterized membrane protein
MRKTLIAGFALLIPIVVTVYFFVFFIDIAALPFLHLSKILLTSEFLEKIPFVENHAYVQKLTAKFIAVLFLLICSYILGKIARYKFKIYLIDKPLDLLLKFPVIGWVISLTRNVSAKLFDPENKFFKESVLVPFFAPNRYCIGLVTSKHCPEFIPNNPELDRVVFVPTSPHPVSGFLIITEAEAVKLIQLDPNEALAFVISCGTHAD